MSLRTLPLLYLNLGGEMMYVLDQRLMAQNVPGNKAVKGKQQQKQQQQQYCFNCILLIYSAGRHCVHDV